MPEDELANGNWLTCVAMAELNAVAFLSAVPVAPAELLFVNTPVEKGIWQTSLVAAGLSGLQSICPIATVAETPMSNRNCRVLLIIFPSAIQICWMPRGFCFPARHIGNSASYIYLNDGLIQLMIGSGPLHQDVVGAGRRLA